MYTGIIFFSGFNVLGSRFETDVKRMKATIFESTDFKLAISSHHNVP